MLASDLHHLIFTLQHNLSSCICNVSIYGQLPPGSCLAFAMHMPYWPPGVRPALCLSLWRSRLVDVGVSCSLHMWHPSPTTVQYGNGSVHLKLVRVSEPQTLQQAWTETSLLDCIWAVLDGASQLGRKKTNTKNDWHGKKLLGNVMIRQERQGWRGLIITKITPTKGLQCVFQRGCLFQLTIPTACLGNWNNQISNLIICWIQSSHVDISI